jgi:cysteine desulfurase / selenocysteine lyase
MDDLEIRLRADFPYLSSCIYLDTASTSLAPPGQGSAVAWFYDGAKRQGAIGKTQWLERTEMVRHRVAKLLNVPATAISFLSSTTEALNLVAHSIPWAGGDEIVLAKDEYPSVIACWESAVRFGARIVSVPVECETQREERLLSAITSRSRVLAVSHAHFSTGTLLNLDRLVAACRANGTMLVVDGIQSLGAVPLSLEAVDVFCSATFKWMLGGYGLSILVVNEPALANLRPAYRGHANLAPARTLQYSHINFPGIYALEAALDYIETIGWRTAWARVAALLQRLETGLGELGYGTVTPPKARAGIISFRARDALALAECLSDVGVIVAERRGLLRVSPHFYNRASDIERFLTAVTNFREKHD